MAEPAPRHSTVAQVLCFNSEVSFNSEHRLLLLSFIHKQGDKKGENTLTEGSTFFFKRYLEYRNRNGRNARATRDVRAADLTVRTKQAVEMVSITLL